MTTQPTQAPGPGRMTADEFIAWAMARPGRFELVDGEVVTMAAERLAHVRVKAEAWSALSRAVRARGLGCEVFADGASVRIGEDKVYEPDVLVRCGPPLPGDDVLVPDPVIVVEVLSRSTRAVDTGGKLAGYFALPSVRHYLVLNPEGRTVIHHRREGGPDDGIATRILHARPADGEAAGPGPELALDPPGLLVRCEDLFEAP